MKPFEYILRFTIQPNHHEEDRFQRLLKFCEAAKIDDVMFFVDCEELNQGHVTKEHLEPWLKMLNGFKGRLAEKGISLSINPWTTLLHADRGRKLAPGQDFDLMCDRHGKKATAQACPISPSWREYIAEIYAMYSSIKPRMIWVEDDFRFHNHSPLEWGGCFCEKHMALFSDIYGKKLERNEFVEGVLKPGKPHPFREIWLKTCCETMLENAKIIEKAVHGTSDETIIGLMSSFPETQCAELRDWQGLLEALSGDKTQAVIRPGLTMYREEPPQEYQWKFQEVTILSRVFAGTRYSFYPELDNGPFSVFSISNSLTRLKLLSSALVESSGITLSLFDMIGTGVMHEERYAKLLADCKPLLESIALIGLNQSEARGVRMLVDQDASRTLETRMGKEITELYPTLGFFKSLLSSFGVATAYTCDKWISGETVAVCGQMLRNLTDEEIIRLFKSNRVILDGESAEILLERGRGSLIYAESGLWEELESGTHTYEQVANGLCIDGVYEARFSSQANCGDYFNIKFACTDGVAPITVQKNPPGETVGMGQALVENRHYIFPYGHFKHYTRVHQEPILQGIILSVMRQWGIPHIIGAANLVVSFYIHEGISYAMLLNFSNDPVSEPCLFLPGSKVHTNEMICYTREHPNGTTVLFEAEDDMYILRGLSLQANDLALVKICA